MLKFQRNVFGDKGIWRNLDFRSRGKRKLLAFFLCLSMLTGFLPGFAAKAEEEGRLSDIVEFQSITLHYAGAGGLPEEGAIGDNALLEKERQLALRYEYEITEAQCEKIQADTRYYLEVSPHLVLPDLGSAGSELTVITEEGPRRFGAIYADGSRAWVVFDAAGDGSGTVLSEYGQLQDAYFYLNCGRAGEPPEEEKPIDGKSNLYAMKFESGEILKFGYAEREPVEAAAQVKKSGSLSGKTITWTIEYTPWQNPSGGELTMDTNFELRDVIDVSLHSYLADSARIGGTVLATYHSRDEITGKEEAYVLAEISEEGGPVTLNFGGRKLQAGAATQGNPAQAVVLTYETAIRDELLLPGGKGGQKVANGVELFAETDGGFHGLNISNSQTVTIPQPVWLTKKGTTTRHDDGTGSTTDWTITFFPNGFSFAEDHGLTLHDQLPAGSALAADSVKINGTQAPAAAEGQSFTVSPIITDNQPVTITYQTQVPEDMYDSGTNLGNNQAWFTFHYNDTDYETPKVTTPVGSGDGSGMSGTATLVKSNKGYNASARTVDWTVTINPHKAYLKNGTFTDDFRAIGGVCSKGHQSGLELAGDESSISLFINNQEPTEDERNLVELDYANQVLTVKTGEIGAKTITIAYQTKVCDPCIFANNTARRQMKNIISTDDMLIGKNASVPRSAKAESIVNASAAVLTKKAPVYDYSSNKMKWTVEVDAAGLPMEEVVLTDALPEGLKYAENSLKTAPAVSAPSAMQQGQELTIDLGSVTQKTAVTFDTEVDPEKTGFSSNESVRVSNTIVMKGKADGIEFAEVSHSASGNFTNHGLVKSSSVDNQKELIQYEVLINPYGLALSENPSLVDTLDKRLQADLDTLRFYKASLSGTTGNSGQKPSYQKEGEGLPLKAKNYDLESNAFTVELPIRTGSRDAYVLTYTADIMRRQAGSYGNSVRFEGGAVLLGGSKNNSASVGGGGGGGGGGVAARKAGISVTKTDSENHEPLAGVSFTLYQWDGENHRRGLSFAQGTTDVHGKLSFLVKPGAVYELEETENLPGYESAVGWTNLPDGVTETDRGLLITAGAAKSELELELTNEPCKTEEQPEEPKDPDTQEPPVTDGDGSPDGSEPPVNPGGSETPENPGDTEPPENPGDTKPPENPGETESPENPGDTKPPENSGGTENPDGSENPSEPGMPENPDGSENPGEPGMPENPDGSEDSGEPGMPENPGGSGNPEYPGNSENPGGSGNPEHPGDSGNPEHPGDSGNPGDSGQPEHPDSSESSENPGTSGNQNMSKLPGGFKEPKDSGNAELPDMSGTAQISWFPDSRDTDPSEEKESVSDSDRNSGKTAGAPKTGDNTVWLEAAVLLSGTILAMMTLYYAWREKKRERK